MPVRFRWILPRWRNPSSWYESRLDKKLDVTGDLTRAEEQVAYEEWLGRLIDRA